MRSFFIYVDFKIKAYKIFNYIIDKAKSKC